MVLRIPEYVKSPGGSETCCPNNVVWEQECGRTRLRYRWDEAVEIKRQWATDFQGMVQVRGDAVTFEVTMCNVGEVPQPWGVFLFCLQCGAWRSFQDYDGQRTFVRSHAGWVTVNQMQAGVFEDHRMCVFPVDPTGVSDNLMAKVSQDGRWVLGLAIDRPGWVSCNHQQWPSCIHANPIWGHLPLGIAAGPDTCGEPLQCGASAIARGKVYLFPGGLDELYERYVGDFGP